MVGHQCRREGAGIGGQVSRCQRRVIQLVGGPLMVVVMWNAQRMQTIVVMVAVSDRRGPPANKPDGLPGDAKRDYERPFFSCHGRKFRHSTNNTPKKPRSTRGSRARQTPPDQALFRCLTLSLQRPSCRRAKAEAIAVRALRAQVERCRANLHKAVATLSSDGNARDSHSCSRPHSKRSGFRGQGPPPLTRCNLS